MDTDIAVSVVCMTYNHEAYITQCLESLVGQKTSFAYEVLVHDDCSTDGTLAVLKKFASDYPSKVNLLVEDENQYSKGVFLRDIISPHIKGRYVALCEGDDWWIDPLKLQRQLDYMEGNPDCSACAHGARRYNDPDACFDGSLDPFHSEVDLLVGDMVKYGALIPTNSFFLRSDLYAATYPAVFRGWGVGDYPLSIWLSLNGRVHYVPAELSAYRYMAKGSWSVRTASSAQRGVDAETKIIAGLQSFDRYTDGRYSEAVADAIESRELKQNVLRRDFSSVRSSRLFAAYPLKKRIALWLRCINPNLANALQRKLRLHG